MWTVYSSTLDFHALEIVYSSLYPGDESRTRLDSALENILAVATKALGEDARQVYRFMWALSVAVCKGEGHGDHEWLSAQLERARVLMPNFGVPGLNLLKEKPVRG